MGEKVWQWFAERFIFLWCAVFTYSWETELRAIHFGHYESSSARYSALHKVSPCTNQQSHWTSAPKQEPRPVASGMLRLNVLQVKFCPGIRHMLGFLNSMFPGFLKKLQIGTLFIISSNSQNQHFLEHIRISMLWRCANTQAPKALLRTETK